MARVNVYLSDELHAAVKGAGLNVSAVCQQALERELVTQGHYDLEILLTAATENIATALEVLREQT